MNLVMNFFHSRFGPGEETPVHIGQEAELPLLFLFELLQDYGVIDSVEEMVVAKLLMQDGGSLSCLQ
jgi:hypothetical protein